MSSWQPTRLGDICFLRTDTVHPAEMPDASYVGLEHIDSGNARLQRMGKASDVTSTKTKFYMGDILYGKLRPYLDKVVIAEDDGICSTDILVIIASDFVSYEYLVHLLHSKNFLTHAIKTTKGVNHPRTSWAALSDFEFLLPPLPEQDAIAHTLRTIQEAQEVRRKELVLEHERKTALIHYLFTYGTRGESRKQTEIGEMPQSWGIINLGEVAALQGGYAFRSQDYVSAGIRLFKIANVSFGEVVWGDISYLPADYSQTYNDYSLEEGDIVMAMTRPITQGGIKAARIRHDDSPSLLNQRVGRFRINERISGDFLYHTIFNPSFIQAIREKAWGLNQPNISSRQVENISISLPSLQEQDEISNILNNADAKISTLEKEISLLEELFKATLEGFMTGSISTLPLVEAEAAA